MLSITFVERNLKFGKLIKSPLVIMKMIHSHIEQTFQLNVCTFVFRFCFSAGLRELHSLGLIFLNFMLILQGDRSKQCVRQSIRQCHAQAHTRTLTPNHPHRRTYPGCAADMRMYVCKVPLLTDGRYKCGRKRIIRKSEQYARLSHSRVADQQEFEEQVVGFLCHFNQNDTLAEQSTNTRTRTDAHTHTRGCR